MLLMLYMSRCARNTQVKIRPNCVYLDMNLKVAIRAWIVVAAKGRLLLEHMPYS